MPRKAKTTTETIWVIFMEEGDNLGWHEQTFLGAAKNREDLKHLEKRTSFGDYGYKKYEYAEVPVIKPEAPKMLKALQEVYDNLGPEATDCGCAGCNYEINAALKAVLPFVNQHYKKRKQKS